MCEHSQPNGKEQIIEDTSVSSWGSEEMKV